MFTKKSTIYIFILILLAILPVITISKTIFSDYYTSTADICASSMMTVGISTIPGTITFNTTTLNVPTNSCVTIIFSNPDSIDNTFTIDKVGGSSNTSLNDADLTMKQINYFNIYLGPNSIGSSNLLTPDVSTTFKYYSAIPGHESAGQFGNLIIGNPSTGSDSSTIPTILFVVLIILLTLGISYYLYVIKNKSDNKSYFKSTHNIKPNKFKILSEKGMICPNCGAAVFNVDKYCQLCGQKLKSN